MKSKLFIIIAAIIVLAVPTVVVAQNGLTVEESTEPAQTQTTTNRPSDEELASRKAERQKRVNEKMSAAKQKRVAARCEASQNKLQAAFNRLNGVYESRQSVYSSLFSRVNNLVSRLDANGEDSATIAAISTELNTQFTQFFADFDTLMFDLGDSTVIDCENDPEGFYLAVQDARQQTKELKKQSKEITKYTKGELRTALDTLKASLVSEEGN